MRLARPPAAAVLAVALAVCTARAQTIDTRGDRDFTIAASTGIAGQTFLTPDGAPHLLDFALWLWTSPGGPYAYRVSLHAWDDAQRTAGPALFTSELRVTERAPDDAVGIAAIFQTPDVVLVTGHAYVALVQRAAPGNVFLGFADLQAAGFQDTYLDGEAVEAVDYASDPALAAYRAVSIGAGTDLRFVAHFGAGPATTVPEPATLALVTPALLTLAGVARRRARTAASPTGARS